MGILIGMDEAGYGPNLGPLVVAATAWEVRGGGFRVQGSGFRGRRDRLAPAEASGRSHVLDPQIRNPTNPQSTTQSISTACCATSSPSRPASGASPSPIRKRSITPGSACGSWSAACTPCCWRCEQSLDCWSAIVQSCAADPDGHHQRHLLARRFRLPLPVDAAPDELDAARRAVRRACDAAGVRPLVDSGAARVSRAIQRADRLLRHQRRGPVARDGRTAARSDRSHSRTDNSASPQPPAPSPPIYAVCDKHGGRNYYTALLQHHFSEHWIEPVFESHAESRYEWGPPESRVRVAFRMNGERFLPTALASMTAKYLRELAMRAFNEFWCARVPDLRPTAGYSDRLAALQESNRGHSSASWASTTTCCGER